MLQQLLLCLLLCCSAQWYRGLHQRFLWLRGETHFIIVGIIIISSSSMISSSSSSSRSRSSSSSSSSITTTTTIITIITIITSITTGTTAIIVIAGIDPHKSVVSISGAAEPEAAGRTAQKFLR